MPTTYAIPDGRVAMAATLYQGNGSTQSVSNAVNGVSFQPDFVWVKTRQVSSSNALFDSVRGVTKAVFSNSAVAESNLSTLGVTAFNSGGFSVTDNSNGDYYSNGASGGTYSGTPPNYVGWNWKAGGTAVSNTAGSITSSVSANTAAGFSVVSYTLNNSTFTVGHGLGVAPSMILVKNRDTANNWDVYHISVGAGSRIVLNDSGTPNATTQVWNNTAPTSTVFSGNSAWWTNPSTSKMIAYCFAPVAGYSAFGSYTGNGSADGPFIYTGFKPEFVMFKNVSAANVWLMLDASRNPYNVVTLNLNANQSASDNSNTWCDFNSNGFKVRNASDGAINTSGNTYIYMAFASNPFKYANAG
jgi:hypothetical protein